MISNSAVAPMDAARRTTLPWVLLNVVTRWSRGALALYSRARLGMGRRDILEQRELVLQSGAAHLG